MDGSIKKRAAWGLLVLLLGAAPALACERDLPHRHEWPGGVSEPRPLAPGALRHQLQILLANREQWDRVPRWEGMVNLAVLDMDWNGQLEILVNAEGVERLDLLRTRMFGNKVYIDAEIAVDGTLSLKDAHAIAEDVHDNVEKKFPNTKHIMIHVNPA